MYSGYPQLAFNFSKKLLHTHAQKFARQGNTEIMSTIYILHHILHIYSLTLNLSSDPTAL